jgi:hypothetical protein
MEGSKMRVSLKGIFAPLAVAALLGTGLAFASPSSQSAKSSEYLSGRVSILLAEIRKETAELGPHAEALGAISGNPQYGWQSHASHLDEVKDHINAVRRRIIELHRIRRFVLPWQDQAILEVDSHAAKVAASAQAALLYLRENKNRLLATEYRDHLTTIADSSTDLKETVDKFLDYDKARQKVRQIQSELELAD